MVFNHLSRRRVFLKLKGKVLLLCLIGLINKVHEKLQELSLILVDVWVSYLWLFKNIHVGIDNCCAEFNTQEWKTIINCALVYVSKSKKFDNVYQSEWGPTNEKSQSHYKNLLFSILHPKRFYDETILRLFVSLKTNEIDW